MLMLAQIENLLTELKNQISRQSIICYGTNPSRNTTLLQAIMRSADEKRIAVLLKNSFGMGFAAQIQHFLHVLSTIHTDIFSRSLSSKKIIQKCLLAWGNVQRKTRKLSASLSMKCSDLI